MEGVVEVDGGDTWSVRSRPLTSGAAVASRAGHGQTWVVGTLRSDLYAAFQASSALVALRERGALFDLLPPSPTEIAEIVTGPAAAAGLRFETRDGEIPIARGTAAGVLLRIDADLAAEAVIVDLGSGNVLASRRYPATAVLRIDEAAAELVAAVRGAR